MLQRTSGLLLDGEVDFSRPLGGPLEELLLLLLLLGLLGLLCRLFAVCLHQSVPVSTS